MCQIFFWKCSCVWILAEYFDRQHLLTVLTLFSDFETSLRSRPRPRTVRRRRPRAHPLRRLLWPGDRSQPCSGNKWLLNSLGGPNKFSKTVRCAGAAARFSISGTGLRPQNFVKKWNFFAKRPHSYSDVVNEVIGNIFQLWDIVQTVNLEPLVYRKLLTVNTYLASSLMFLNFNNTFADNVATV